jgi:iron(III) transport system permease protein
LGFFCGYLIQNRALRLWRSLDTLTLLLFMLPGTVIGVGLIALWNRPGTGFIYGSAALVIVAYLAQYTALTSRITCAALANVPPSLEEAAQLAGVPWHARMAHVVLPAVLPGVIAAWVIGFIFCLHDVGASMLVYPAGQDTLPVRIFTLMANGSINLISALCVMLMVATLLSLAVLGSLLGVTVVIDECHRTAVRIESLQRARRGRRRLGLHGTWGARSAAGPFWLRKNHRAPPDRRLGDT